MDNTSTKMYSKIAYLSSVLMLAGIHFPLYLISKGSEVVLVSRTNYEGIFLLISAMVVIIQKYTKKNKFLFVPLTFDIGIIVYHVFLVKSQENFITVSWGFVCEVIAVLLLFIDLCTRKVVEKDFTHDLSTMRVVSTDEYSYCDDVTIRDSVWIVGIIIFTTIFVMFKLNIDKRNSDATAGNVSSKSVSASENTITTATQCDYENENYCVSIFDGYITNEDGEEVVFIEVSLKNKTKAPFVFNELFEIDVKQGKQNLTRCTKVDSDIFDSNSSLAQISLFETSKVYIPFVLLDSQKNLKVTLRSISSSESPGEVIVNEKIVKINNLYYVDTLEEIISIGERKMEAEDKAVNKNVDNEGVGMTSVSSSPQATENATTQQPTETAGRNENEPTQEVTQTEEPVDTEGEEESNPISGTVKFVKPDSWDETVRVYLNIYENEDDVVEKTRIVNSGYDDGEFTFFLSDINMSGKVYITFGNDSEIYPANNKKLELVMGKKYTSN